MATTTHTIFVALLAEKLGVPESRSIDVVYKGKLTGWRGGMITKVEGVKPSNYGNYKNNITILRVHEVI